MKDKITFSRELELREYADSVRFRACARKFFDASIDIVSGVLYSICIIYFFYVFYNNNFDRTNLDILMWLFLLVVLLISFIVYLIDIFYIGDFEITGIGIDIKFRDKKCFIPKKNIKDFEVCDVPRRSEQMIMLVLNEPLIIDNSLIKRKKFQLIKSLNKTNANYLKKKFDSIIFNLEDEPIEDEGIIYIKKKKKQSRKMRKKS